MELKVENYRCLPCSLSVFTINGKYADYEDFGEKHMIDGNCFENTCGCIFSPKLPSSGVLNKYGITVDEYSEVVSELTRLLNVSYCGWCS